MAALLAREERFLWVSYPGAFLGAIPKGREVSPLFWGHLRKFL